MASKSGKRELIDAGTDKPEPYICYNLLFLAESKTLGEDVSPNCVEKIELNKKFQDQSGLKIGRSASTLVCADSKYFPEESGLGLDTG